MTSNPRNILPLAPETLVTLAFGAATGTNQGSAVALLTLTDDRKFIKVVNLYNVDMVLTYTPPGGVIKDFEIVPNGAALTVDLTSDACIIPKGSIIATWAQAGVAPGSGNMYLSSF